MFQKMPNTLVKTQPFFKIPPCLQQRILFKFNQTLLAWDFMDYIIPDLSMAYNITFDESVMKQNLKRSTAIYNSIRTKFVPKYREFFFGLCTWELEPLVWQGTKVMEPSRNCLCDFDSCLAPRDASTFGFESALSCSWFSWRLCAFRFAWQCWIRYFF